MGILNVTPDSFSDGGRFLARDAALRQAEQMLCEQVDLIDIGGESSRPGATALPLQQELDRVIPLIDALRDCGVPLSVDTYKPAVMQAALTAGADLINDIYGFRQPGAVQAVADANCGLCVMHMAGDPRNMQEQPEYDDVVVAVRDFLAQRVAALEQAGVVRARISVDPGFGFGKSVAHNYALLAHLSDLAPTDVPLLAGISRKSMLGAVTGRAVAAERVAASVAAAVCAAERGAKLLRVHDVAATVDALKVWQAVRAAQGGHQ
ncbi:dihydropteroate synthase [Burkholderia sp. L27(2015)]|uniref:dihydropteroate synthase n=1 Tax=Burkholderia sp. L27(2015) TaxID=1641858 RepID=UPI00131BD49D|nr:dihydropteroate synthase [Burkholderia sp. L27(2015)]